MMLKDIFKKKENNSEKILKSIADGYVDIKIYQKDGDSKKLVYHDTGDNTVTNWMRQIILQLLAGYPLSSSGREGYDGSYINAGGDSEDKDAVKYLSGSSFSMDDGVTTLNPNFHDSSGTNLDGCTVGVKDGKYFFDSTKCKTNYLKMYDDGEWGNYKYPVFPTKVLLGTGKEYISWEHLKAETEGDVSSDWYSEKIEWYGVGGGEDAAKTRFEELLTQSPNIYSATVGVQGNYTGEARIVPSITVNDPSSNMINDSAADLASRYGVVGAIKTLYLKNGANTENTILGTEPDDMLNPTISESGKLLKTNFRGAGVPCFIYFKRNSSESLLDWGKTGSATVSLSKDTGNTFLNRITFRIVMPSQETGEYYPYNGFTLKQIGLFNDSLFENLPGTPSTIAEKMPFGTMLAVKNVAGFTKTADQEVSFTWTLTM